MKRWERSAEAEYNAWYSEFGEPKKTEIRERWRAFSETGSCYAIDCVHCPFDEELGDLCIKASERLLAKRLNEEVN